MNGISVIGLGKLGLCSAACFAEGGYRVWGVDINEENIRRINQGDCPIEETGLVELLSKVSSSLMATSDYDKAISNSGASFIIVPTPSLDDGKFSNAYVEDVLGKIGAALRKKNGYHLVVITSTVMPGTTENIARPLLEEASGKICGKDFGLVYNPEFIALGSVIRDFKNPDFLLIGESRSQDGKILEEIYSRTCENTPAYAHLSPLNAEIAKICLNCYVTTKITFANSLGAICESVPGADANQITGAIGLDSRIGAKYFKTGLGFGGPCFPRDNRAFAAFARDYGNRAKISELVDEINEEQLSRIVHLAKEKLEKGDKVAILGLSYKPDTPIIEESQAVDIARELFRIGYRVSVYDPQAMENTKKEEGDIFEYSDNMEECLNGSSLCLISTPWKEFKSINADFLISKMKNPVVIDCWKLLKNIDLAGVEYILLGEGVASG